MKLDPLADYAQQNDLGQEVRSPRPQPYDGTDSFPTQTWSRYSSPSSVLHNPVHLPRVAPHSTLSPSPVTSESSTAVPDHHRHHAYTPFFQHPSTYPPMRLPPLGLGGSHVHARAPTDYPSSYPVLPMSRPPTASTSSAGSTSGSGGSSPRLAMGATASQAMPTWYGQSHPTSYDWHPQAHLSYSHLRMPSRSPPASPHAYPAHLPAHPSTSSSCRSTPDIQGGKKPSARPHIARRASNSVAPYEGVMGVSAPGMGSYPTSSHMGMGMSAGLGLVGMAGMGMGMEDGRKGQVGPPGGGGGEQILGMGLDDVDESMLEFTSRQDTKPTRLLRRQCFNCRTWRDVSAWRRSIIQPGHIVCNKCGLYEKAHKRARPLNERGEFVRPGKSAAAGAAHQHLIHAHPPLTALPSLCLSGTNASAAKCSPKKGKPRGGSGGAPAAPSPPRRDSLGGEERKREREEGRKKERGDE